MAERKTREEKMSAVQQKLENGVREIFSSEKYKEYIAAMSKFPKYSLQGTTQGNGLTGGVPPVRFSM